MSPVGAVSAVLFIINPSYRLGIFGENLSAHISFFIYFVTATVPTSDSSEILY
jgi:hypothetical protein